MVSYLGYKALHLFAVFLTFSALGGLAALRLVSEAAVPAVLGRVLGLLHAAALLLVLLAGFGLMARLGILASWPAWIWLKLIAWLLFAASGALVRRAPRFAGVWLWALPLLGAAAAWLALHKPLG